MWEEECCQYEWIGGQKNAYIHHSSTLKFDVRVDQLGLKKLFDVRKKCETDAWVKSDRETEEIHLI